jgi:DNA-binding NarL/FixJ family response regulator
MSEGAIGGTVLRVVLAEDNILVREGTRQVLESGDGVAVIAVASDAVALLEAVDEHHPDVVVTDIRMPPGHHMEGIEAAHAIRERWPSIGVVVLSQYADEAYAFALLRNGTAGLAYLLKERVLDRADLVRALKETSEGRSVLDPLVVDALVSRRARQERSRLSELTERELAVLALMAEGRTNAGIGRELHLSSSAVEKHINAIFGKFGLGVETEVHRRVAAVVTFLQQAGRTDLPQEGG